MDSNKLLLKKKLVELNLKLQAKDFVKDRISYHWIPILDSIISQGIFYEIVSLCNVTQESYLALFRAIEDLKHPALCSSLIQLSDKNMIDDFYIKFPSLDKLKYVMNLPKINSPNQEFHEIISQKEGLPNFEQEQVFFLSPDWSPVIKLNWKDIIEKGELIFNDIPLSYMFSNLSFSKILFKSLEDDWYVVK